MAFGAPMPERIGRYEILLQIARGGMATVYLARTEGHGGFDRYIALKLTAEHLRDDPEFGQHLVDEAKLVAHLRHQNVVPVLDVGEDGLGAVFLVMEYVPGDSLGGLFKLAKKNSDPLTPRIGLRILIDSLAGLHAAHEHRDEHGQPLNVVHRDFSPQNILVGTDGIARLTDFGIAKAASRASVTVAGTMKGKVSYASPEQARGKELDRRCDVWAGGVMAWEIFAERKLFPSSERTLLDVVSGTPARIRTLVPSVPPEIDDIIARALTVEVADRTPTAQAFARELSAAATRHDLLATNEEVAEYVQRAVAPILEDRKALMAEARMRRMGTPSQPDLSTVPLPALPDLPFDSTMAMPAPVAPPPLVGPMPVPDESARQRPPSFDRFNNPGSTTPAGIEQPLQHPQNGPREQLARLLREKPAVVIGAGVGLGVLLLVIGLVVVLAGGEKKQAKTVASASSVATTPEPAPAPSVTTAKAVLPEGEPLPVQLEITASAPVARLELPHRMVEMEVPAPAVAIELTPEESSAAIAVVARTADGRVGNGVWNPGDAELAITFGSAPPAVAAPSGPRPKPGGRKPKHR